MYNVAYFLTLFPSQFFFMVDKTLLSQACTLLYKCFCHNMCPVHRTHNGAVEWAKDCKVQSGQQLNYINAFFFHFQLFLKEIKNSNYEAWTCFAAISNSFVLMDQHFTLFISWYYHMNAQSFINNSRWLWIRFFKNYKKMHNSILIAVQYK